MLEPSKLFHVRIRGRLPDGRLQDNPPFGVLAHAVFVRVDPARARVILPIQGDVPRIAARTVIDGQEWWSLGGHSEFYVQAKASGPNGPLGLEVMVIRPDQTQMRVETSVEVSNPNQTPVDPPAQDYVAVELLTRFVNNSESPGWQFP